LIIPTPILPIKGDKKMIKEEEMFTEEELFMKEMAKLQVKWIRNQKILCILLLLNILLVSANLLLYFFKS
jgi:hypothetical protein